MRWKSVRTGASLVALFAAPELDAQQSATTYSYDALGRLTEVVTTGGANAAETRSICYDDAGNRTQYVANRSAGASLCSEGGSTVPPPPSLPSLRISDASVSEGGFLNFVVTLSGAPASPVSVQFATASNTANTTDYVSNSGVLIFAQGQTSRSLAVMTREDSAVEANEQLFVNLSNPSGATIADTRGVGTILNDDSAGPPPPIDPGCGEVFC